MNFAEALLRLKGGERISRSGWNGKNMYLSIIRDAYSSDEGMDFEPFICMYTADQKNVPWLASQTDILANDWGVV